MVLVRVGQDEDVDPAVPWREALVEQAQQPVGIGSAVDEEASPTAAFDEDRVTLADVEHGDPHATVGSMQCGDGEGDRPGDDGAEDDSGGRSTGGFSGSPA